MIKYWVFNSLIQLRVHCFTILGDGGAVTIVEILDLGPESKCINSDMGSSRELLHGSSHEALREEHGGQPIGFHFVLFDPLINGKCKNEKFNLGKIDELKKMKNV